MQNTKKSSKSWFVLGIVFYVILLVAVYLQGSSIIKMSYGAEMLLAAIFGFGGTLFIVIGIVKFVINLFKKS
jgi:hypothetical protein